MSTLTWRGVDSHGVTPNLVVYLQEIRNGAIKPGAKTQITNDAPSVALVNGNWGSKSMEIASEKAEKTGVGAVEVFKCNHAGTLSAYAQMAVDSGMVGFITANCEPYVAAFGGRERVLGTNPLCYGILMGDEKTIVVDYVTGMAAEGKVRAALYKGQQLPPGWIVDARGLASTNRADLYEPPLSPERIKFAGALLSSSGYKGYGLALVVNVLAGILTGAGTRTDMKGQWLVNGFFMIDRFVPLRRFEAQVGKLARTIKNSLKAEACHEILLPGEPEIRGTRN